MSDKRTFNPPKHHLFLIIEKYAVIPVVPAAAADGSEPLFLAAIPGLTPAAILATITISCTTITQAIARDLPVYLLAEPDRAGGSRARWSSAPPGPTPHENLAGHLHRSPAHRPSDLDTPHAPGHGATARRGARLRRDLQPRAARLANPLVPRHPLEAPHRHPGLAAPPAPASRNVWRDPYHRPPVPNQTVWVARINPSTATLLAQWDATNLCFTLAQQRAWVVPWYFIHAWKPNR